ncbi:rhamnogalacturonan acetylesterase [Paenibacillus woosongensis]|uniref:Rhamnogalacturonan acetylesterase n=1 Tax=Paenibacillus woosongensis TaxID=307580 RepID=A0AA95L0M2_9BACL|nr:rhamnogalacturonan acetylesterase [Paenibacillus woosongensis]WHX48504.1 rhamnogalacturonan acetylesterase [Paenibacillus woosongensis]
MKDERKGAAAPGLEKMSWKFDFGPGQPAVGYTGVTAESVYDSAAGYGFEDINGVYARDRLAAAAAVPGDVRAMLYHRFCIPMGATFTANVPDGVYVVSILAGDALAETHTLLKVAGSKRVLPPIRSAAGQFIEEKFAVPVRGGRFRLHVSGQAPRLNMLELQPAPNTLTLFLAGDSTVTDQPEDGYPYAGWGQLLPALFKHDVCVDNHAQSGRSSRSFIEEGRLEAILQLIKPGDFLMLQFGHNDEKPDPRGTDPFTTYKQHLLRYIEAAREKRAYPVLVTPVHRRYFNPDGTLSDTHGDYITAMQELAAETDTPLIDLAARSKRLFETAGPEGCKDLFMWVYPGEYMNFPAGVQDNTHFQEQGGEAIARLIADGIGDLQLQPLFMYLR